MRPSETGRLIVVSVAIGFALSLSLAASRLDEAQRTVAEQAADLMACLEAYAAGDDLAVHRLAHGKPAFNIVGLHGLEPIVARKDVPLRIRAAFILEAMALGAKFAAPIQMRFGRTIFEDEAKPLGADPEADRFEVLWHQTALAIAQRLELFAAQARHLEAIWPRFDAARRSGVEPASRLQLARAIAAAGLCCPDALPGVFFGVTTIDKPVKTEGSVESALVLFEEAAAIPALEVEARVRAGVLLYGVGRQKQAIELLERVPAHDDAMLGYMQYLTIGHAYEALDRLPEAAAAYARARAYMPTAQSAAIGEAAVLLRLGRADDAARVADAARSDTLVAAALDPRQMLRHGDTRFIDQWLAEIRRMRR